ncbi:MAG: YraN family protein [Opitutales bacterium]|nr:YraN family protein [Opitutales bacterium]
MGEETAVRWLQKERRMRLITRNWRSGRGELDIIMEDRGVLVFVEVRARSGAHPRTIFATVNKKKKRLIRQTAKAYLRGLRESPRTIRFDVVALTAAGRAGDEVFHYEGVPLFGRNFRA